MKLTLLLTIAGSLTVMSAAVPDPEPKNTYRPNFHTTPPIGILDVKTKVA